MPINQPLFASPRAIRIRPDAAVQGVIDDLLSGAGPNEQGLRNASLVLHGAVSVLRTVRERDDVAGVLDADLREAIDRLARRIEMLDALIKDQAERGRE